MNLDWLRQLRFRFVALLRRKTLEAEMAEELRTHLEIDATARRAEGLSATAAREAAQRNFGMAEQIKERCRDQRAWTWLEQTRQDLRYATRQMVKAPGFSATAIITLAIGIGATTAIFSLLNAMLLRPLPVEAPGQLVFLRKTGGDETFAYPVFDRLREHVTNFAGLSSVQLGVSRAKIIAGMRFPAYTFEF